MTRRGRHVARISPTRQAGGGDLPSMSAFRAKQAFQAEPGGTLMRRIRDAERA